MEECPDGKQHFISPNLPATAKPALFAMKRWKDARRELLLPYMYWKYWTTS
jgi:hypothetical protein